MTNTLEQTDKIWGDFVYTHLLTIHKEDRLPKVIPVRRDYIVQDLPGLDHYLQLCMLYTQDEWETGSPADWEVYPDGTIRFLGTVEPSAELEARKEIL